MHACILTNNNWKAIVELGYSIELRSRRKVQLLSGIMFVSSNESVHTFLHSLNTHELNNYGKNVNKINLNVIFFQCPSSIAWECLTLIVQARLLKLILCFNKRLRFFVSRSSHSNTQTAIYCFFFNPADPRGIT